MKFVFDLDGTICFNGGPVSPRMMNYLKELSVDHEIIFASARPIRDLLPVIDPYFLWTHINWWKWCTYFPTNEN
ncbi:HAD hydrolase family protein [Carnobacterium maltaromaticum]|uniref:HAD hydrolase family protein n=1 Tax=Carnobacterium maltaromaticum TaxID=2751 RepID=UPI00295E53F3|nr:HAD hydrolase family protein [Carnobacterium maltaromaticum]